ncbi:MAG: hypothetical protein LBK76_09930 [Verrucomicrobiales bacterium]|jgi:hypothetical protein|nr:hypothetical protein [Verrucomicrobiales bacterium]
MTNASRMVRAAQELYCKASIGKVEEVLKQARQEIKLAVKIARKIGGKK